MISNEIKKRLDEVFEYYILKLQIQGYEPITKEMGEYYYDVPPVGKFKNDFIMKNKVENVVKKSAGVFYLTNYKTLGMADEENLNPEDFHVKKIVYKPTYQEFDLFHDFKKTIAGISLQNVNINFACITTKGDEDTISYFPKTLKDFTTPETFDTFKDLYNFAKT
jgi:hypothetical protein